MIILNRKQITECVENGSMTNEICQETNRPIMLGANYFQLYGKHYIETDELDINKIIERESDGLYKTSEDIYYDGSDEDEDGDTDFFYCTSKDDLDEIVDDIIADGSYINEDGMRITILIDNR